MPSQTRSGDLRRPGARARRSSRAACPRRRAAAGRRAPLPIADRARVEVAGEVIEGRLGEVGLAADAVHDLQAPSCRRGRAADSVSRMKAKYSNASQSKPSACNARSMNAAVTDPGVPVVPVPLATGRLGERRGGGSHDGAGRGVAEALECERAAFDVRTELVVGEVGDAHPLPPEVLGAGASSNALVVVDAVERVRVRPTTATRSTRTRRARSVVPPVAAGADGWPERRLLASWSVDVAGRATLRGGRSPEPS